MRKKLDSKINEGISADIFQWENRRKIIKLAKEKKSYGAMTTEYLNSQFAWMSGLSVPQPFELIEVNGRLGIVFERIYGNTLKRRFENLLLPYSNTAEHIRESNYKDMARISAKILSETHRKSNVNMPSQISSILHSIKVRNYIPSQRGDIINSIEQGNFLKASDKKLVIDVLNKIPIKQQLCHGDPNLNNILIRNNDKKAFLIDWMYATIGNPEADIAEYIIIIRYSNPHIDILGKFPDRNNSIREKIIKEFIDEYTKLSGINYEEIDPWIMPMAARRLSAGVIGNNEKRLLLDEIRRRLKKYK